MSSSDKALASHTRRRMPRADREQQLLDVAEREFIQRGYEGTSLEDIARAAGVTRPVIYEHFGSKDGVYLACLQRARSKFEHELGQAMQNASDPIDRLRRGIYAYLEFVQSHGDSWDILFGGGIAMAGAAAEAALDLRFVTVQHINVLIGQSVASHVDPVTVEAYAHAISGAGEQIAKWWRRNPQLTLTDVADYLMAFAMRGVLPLLDRDTKPHS